MLGRPFTFVDRRPEGGLEYGSRQNDWSRSVYLRIGGLRTDQLVAGELEELDRAVGVLGEWMRAVGHQVNLPEAGSRGQHREALSDAVGPW
jgi:hypothetical protein